MNWIADGLLWLHVLAGFSAFFIGPVVMIVKKGGATHRKWGKNYLYAIAVVTVTAIVLALFRPNPFLLLIAIFSFYFAFTGYRVLRRKRPDKGQKPQRLDWLFAGVTLIACLAMAGWGVMKMVQNQMAFAIVLLTFGGIGAVSVAFDLRKFVWPAKDRFAWWYDHMGAMVGSYIAAVTAFSVQNFKFLPALAAWLWPTVIGIVGLTIWTRYYKRKFSGRAAKAGRAPLPEKWQTEAVEI